MEKTIDELLQSPCWIIDILPKQVPKDGPGQYFAIEKYYFQEDRLAEIREKHIRLVLKLNCYIDISLDEEPDINPPPERIADDMRNRPLYIMAGDAMILSDPDETYLTVYHPDPDMLELIGKIAQSEGLFVWQPPV